MAKKTILQTGTVNGTYGKWDYAVVTDKSFVEHFGTDFICNCNKLTQSEVICRTLDISQLWLDGKRTFNDVIEFSTVCNSYEECCVDDVVWIPRSWIDFVEKVFSGLSAMEYDLHVTRK